MHNIYLLSETKLNNSISNPIITTEFLEVSNIPNFDCLIFTSKNAVIAFDKIFPDWKKYPSFAIGEATSKTIQKLGGRVSFVCENHYGSELAKVINNSYRGLTFLWPRAKKVAVELSLSIKSSKCFEVVVYETKFNSSFRPIPNESSAIVFSSPSIVDYFMKNQDWKNSYKAIAIGNTTAKRLQDFGIESIVPKTQTLKACVETAKMVLAS